MDILKREHVFKIKNTFLSFGIRSRRIRRGSNFQQVTSTTRFRVIFHSLARLLHSRAYAKLRYNY